MKNNHLKFKETLMMFEKILSNACYTMELLKRPS
jgi:hypothetical protein